MFLKNLKNVKKKYMVAEVDTSAIDELNSKVKKFQSYLRNIIGGSSSFNFLSSAMVTMDLDSLPGLGLSDCLESGCYLFELYEFGGCCYKTLTRVKREKSYVDQTRNRYNYFNRNENKYLDGFELKDKVASDGELTYDGIRLLNLPDNSKVLKRVLFFDSEEEALLLANLKDGEFKKVTEIPSEIDALLASTI